MLKIAPQIIQYQGSKRLLAPMILAYFPNKVRKLWEPFAGMAAVTIAAATHHSAETFHLNDINIPLVQILQNAINSPLAFLDEYSRIWSEQFSDSEGDIGHFYKIREEFNNGDKSAAKLLYLIARCVKGAVRYGRDGKFNQSLDKRRHGTRPDNLLPRFMEISRLLKGKTSFTSVDYRELFEQTQEGDLVYMDPPYQGVSNTRDHRYLSGIELDDLAISLEALNRKNVDFLVSYDGFCGDKSYGDDLPSELGCKKILLNAGYSSQALLLGEKKVTREALYLSRNLVKQTGFPCEQLEFDWSVQHE